jgi:hypothetical protein
MSKERSGGEGAKRSRRMAWIEPLTDVSVPNTLSARRCGTTSFW